MNIVYDSHFPTKFIGDSGGPPRPSFKENWTPLVDVGENELEELNLKIQHKIYSGSGSHFNVFDGVNAFAILASLKGIDEENPVVEFVAERFTNTQEIAAPDVNSVDGGVVLVMYLLDSGSSTIVSSVDSPNGFQGLSSDVAKSGESMSAFVASTEGGGCTGPIIAAITSGQSVSGIVVSVSLRPQDAAVQPLLVPCGRHAEWNATRELELNELISFYNSTGGPKWIRKGGWLKPAIEQCSWEGVNCNDIGLVTSLSLPRYGLTGHLPRIDGFRFLQKLDLSSNNQLGGTFDAIGAQNLTNLTFVALSGDKLSGTLGDIAQSLRYLDLSSNIMDGTVSLTQGANSSLTHLNLGSNNFQSVNVSQLSSLQYLDLSKNKKLKHHVADIGIGNLYDLESLILAGSPLTDDLRIGHLQSLFYLDINSVGLGGSIEETGIMNLTNLTHVDLFGNDFSGYFNFCNYTFLGVLNVQGNSLYANLTDAGCNYLSLFRYIDLSGGNNSYTGSFASIGQLQMLEYINVRGNAFYGPLPGDEPMMNLTYLDLSQNAFTGALPNFTAPNLRHLDVSYNEFEGQMPSSIGSLQTLQHLDCSNQRTSVYYPSTGLRQTTGLTGQIPETIGQLRFLQTLLLSKNLVSRMKLESCHDYHKLVFPKLFSFS